MFRSDRESAASKKFYKKGIDADEMKKRREDSNFSIRRQKRNQQMKKRRLGVSPPPTADTRRFTSEEIVKQLENLPITVAQLQSPNKSERFSAVVTLRKLLSIEKNPPINQVIQAGAIKPLVVVLNQDPDQNNQFEAAWALTNVASGTSEQTCILIRNEGANAFMGKINANAPSLVKEQSVWAIGNIAGDSHPCRDHLLHLGAMQLLIDLTGPTTKPSLRRNAVWAISNLCRGKPCPPFSAIAPAIPVLAKLLDSEDSVVVTDACWALSYISDGDDDSGKISTIIDAGVCRSAVRLLNHQSSGVQTPALRVIGNIVTGDEAQTQIAISCGCLPALKLMLDSVTKKSIKREVCWTLSNITAGSPQQITAVIEANIIDSLIYHMTESEFDVRKEAAWAIANATSSGTPEQITELVRKGCVLPLCDLAAAPDVRVVAVSLEGLENILRQGELLKPHNNQINPFAHIVESGGGLAKLESLSNHPSVPIYEKAKTIVTTYFRQDDDEPAQDTNAATFNFGADSAPASGFSF